MLSTQQSKAQFTWDDPLHLNEQLTEDERMVREAAYDYCQSKLQPRVLEAFRHEKTDQAIFREMGELGLLGPTIPAAYGGPELNYVSYGLIAREIVIALHGEVTRLLREPEYMQREIVAKGYELVAGTPEEFASFLTADSARNARAVKISGARAD